MSPKALLGIVAIGLSMLGLVALNIALTKAGPPKKAKSLVDAGLTAAPTVNYLADVEVAHQQIVSEVGATFQLTELEIHADSVSVSRVVAGGKDEFIKQFLYAKDDRRSTEPVRGRVVSLGHEIFDIADVDFTAIASCVRDASQRFESKSLSPRFVRLRRAPTGNRELLIQVHVGEHVRRSGGADYTSSGAFLRAWGP